MKKIEKIICAGYGIMLGAFVWYGFSGNTYQINEREIVEKPAIEYSGRQQAFRDYSKKAKRENPKSNWKNYSNLA